MALTVVDGNAALNTIAEGAANNTSVGIDLATTGSSGTVTYSISEQTSPGAFQIDPNTGEIRVLDGTKIDFESSENGQLFITVHVQDTATPVPNFLDLRLAINVENVAGPTKTGDAAANTIAGTAEEEQIFGLGDADDIDGAGGNDTIDGGAGDDTIEGGDGNDKIFGGLDDDSITGGAGDDDIEGGAGLDILNGGTGNNTLRYSTSSAGVTVDLVGSTATGGDATGDTIANFRNVVGSSSVDIITGDTTDNVIDGGGNADILAGGANGTFGDTISYASSSSAVTVALGKNGTLSVGVGGDAQGDQLTGFENILGSQYADKLTGNNLGNTIEGGAGADILDGGEGIDTLSYLNSLGAVTLTVGAAGAQATGAGGDAAGDKFSNFENVTGSRFNDAITGNELANLLSGNDGNDALSGAAGADTLFGGRGNDTLTGGAGDDLLVGGGGIDTLTGSDGVDTVSYAGSDAVKIILGANGALSLGQGSEAAGDKISLVENIIGSDFDDTLTGNNLDNTIEGGLGDDLLDGGTGANDTVSYETAGVGVTVDLSVTAQQNTIGAGKDTLKNFENIVGSAQDDTLSGGDNDNVIEGRLGTNVLFGGLGKDTLSYAHSAAGVNVTLDNAGDSLVTGAGFADTATNFENIRGSEFADNLIGNIALNKIEGLGGNDFISGGGEADILDGGAGTDTLSFLFATGAGVTLALGAAGVVTTVVTSGSAGAEKISNFENVIGTTFADNITGNALDNLFDGNGGADIINGSGGIDTLTYAWAASAVQVKLGAAGAQTAVTGGDTDKISFIENITGTNFADTIGGNELNNILLGGAGNDAITGGAGADTLDGGAGDDSFTIAGADALSDKIDGGADNDSIVVSGISAVTLTNFDATASNIETWSGNGASVLGTSGNNILDFSGLATIAGIFQVDGGAGADTLVAHSSGMTLIGNAGDDSLVGGTGADTLDGGDGEDTLTGGNGVNTLLGGKGDDTITGGTGVDTITGGAGADHIAAGNGNDVIIISGTDAQFDSIDGGAGTNEVRVAGIGDVTLALFDAGGSNVQTWVGNGAAVLGDGTDNLIDLSGLTSSSGISFISGGAGDDVLKASNAGIDVRGGSGDDAIFGGTGADILNGGVDADTIDAGAGNDRIIVSGSEAQFDTINGGADTDAISVVGSLDIVLSGFNAGASSIEQWIGNSKALLGDASNNVLDLSGLTSVSNLSFIDAMGGDDILTAAATGSDLRGGSGNDTLNGSAIVDTLNGGTGIDIINAGDGDDTIIFTGAESQLDTINGGLGSDKILVTGTTAVTLRAFGANSVETWIGNGKGVLGDEFANTLDFSGVTIPNNIGAINGGAGNDVITGTSTDDVLSGGIGNDTLSGGNGADTLDGGIGIDIVAGGAGADKIVISGVEGQFDTLNGGTETDTLSFLGTTVTLNGFNAATSSIEILAANNAIIVGDAGNNNFDFSGLTSVTGYKSIDGGAGDDSITGVNLAGVSDDIRGGTGNDVLLGGRGADKLAGGSGSDTFVFDAIDFGKDTISDYKSGADHIEFDDSVFATAADALAAAAQVGANTVITFDEGNTITLTGVQLSSLNLNDFAIV